MPPQPSALPDTYIPISPPPQTSIHTPSQHCGFGRLPAELRVRPAWSCSWNLGLGALTAREDTLAICSPGKSTRFSPRGLAETDQRASTTPPPSHL